jgi:hypothetical protein
VKNDSEIKLDVRKNFKTRFWKENKMQEKNITSCNKEGKKKCKREIFYKKKRTKERRKKKRLLY